MANIIGKDIGKWSFHIFLIRVYVDRTTLENYLAVSTKFVDMHILWSNNTTLEYIPNRKAHIYLIKHVGKKVHKSIIHNIPNLETTQMPLNNEVDKWVIYSYNGTYSKEKESATAENTTDKSTKHMEQKKPNIKEYILYDSICNMFQNRQIIFCWKSG